MAVDQIFRVATEFRFDIGHAVLASDTLQEKVQGISNAADNALLSFQHLGAGVVASLGLGSGGLVGTLMKAIQVSDKFNSSALSFANVISADMRFLQGDIADFNSRLGVSRAILMDIAKQANKFSLDEGSLLNMTKLLAPVLIPHGAAGTNMSNAVDLSRNVLKASPSLGLNPADIEGQLIRTIMGQASMGDTLFRRLLSETQAFAPINKGGNKGGSAAFNAMSFEKRFQMLHKGLNQFANDIDVINANANSLQGNMQRMKNLLGGLNSILKPLGDAILPPLLGLFRQLNDVLDNQIRKTIESVSTMVKGLLEDPKALIVNLMQLRSLGSDVKSGGTFLGLITALSFVSHAAKFFGIQITALLHPFKFLASGLMSIVRMVPWMSVFAFAAKALGFVLTRLLVPMMAVVGLFQVISRAKAIAKLNDAKNLVDLMPQLTALFAKIKQAVSNMLLPFTMVFDALAEFIAPIFQVTTWMGVMMPLFETFVDIMETLGKAVVRAMAGFQGLVFAFMQFFENVKSGNIFNAFKGVGDAMNAGIDDFLERNAARLNDPNGAVVNQVTNIGKVEIRNDFKEQQEPDRVAFTVKEQLMKAARNPRQGRGTGLQNAFAR